MVLLCLGSSLVTLYAWLLLGSDVYGMLQRWLIKKNCVPFSHTVQLDGNLHNRCKWAFCHDLSLCTTLCNFLHGKGAWCLYKWGFSWAWWDPSVAFGTRKNLSLSYWEGSYLFSSPKQFSAWLTHSVGCFLLEISWDWYICAALFDFVSTCPLFCVPMYNSRFLMYYWVCTLSQPKTWV